MSCRRGGWLALLMASAAAHAETDTVRRRVLILMFDGVQIIDFAAPYEVFGQAGYEVRTVSKDGGPVTTAMRLKVSVDHSFASAPPADILVVPGGDVQATADDAITRAWVQERAGPARAVLSVCTGSDILAASGLLDGKSATTFHRHFEHMAATFPAVTVVRDQRWVDAGNIVTSAGLASGIDAALHVVARLDGEDAARSTALHLEYDWSPRQGFVRGLLADRYLRMPEPEVEFPSGTRLRRETSIGDTRTWRTDFAVESSVGPEALLGLLRERARADVRLSVIPGDDPLKLAWRYAADDGTRWRVDVTAIPSAVAGAFRVRSELVRLDATQGR